MERKRNLHGRKSLKRRRARTLHRWPRGLERYVGHWQVQARFIDDPAGAMQHFRALFADFDAESADAPLTRDPATADAEGPVRR